MAIMGIEKNLLNGKKRLLVTGGAGFIGYHLCNKLRDLGHSVIAIDNGLNTCRAKDNKYVLGDIRNEEDISEFIAGSDLVFHLAAQISVDRSIHYPQETSDINIVGTQKILEICKQSNVPMIFASSSEIYGTSQTDTMSESHPLDAQSPYAASKVAGDRMCWAYYKTYGSDIRILRNFNTAGAYQSDNSYGAVIAIFVSRALKDEPLKIFGNGEQMRDYMSVHDAVDAYVKIAERGFPGIILNAGSGVPVKIIDIAKKVIAFSGSKSEIVFSDPRPGEVFRLCCDNSKARLLGWRPIRSIEDIIRETIKEKRKENESTIF
jgi:UDP-glucose 4-epimerase